MRLKNKIATFITSPVIQNSLWGLASSLFQNVLLSIFFIIIARKYSTFDFSQFLIANTLYQIVAAFSTLGLGQWFIREYLITENKKRLIGKFLKIQFFSGTLFYLLSIALAYLLYNEELVRNLSIILGINVIFDNIIFAIKSLNIAEYEQKKTFIILLIDSILRFLIGVVLIIFPFSISVLAISIILIRFTTVYLFINIGVKDLISLRGIIDTALKYSDLKELIIYNWSFIVIGGISIVYWRIAGIIISKTLTSKDVADYEVSFKIFLLAQLIPLIISSSIFPRLVKLYTDTNKDGFRSFYRLFYQIYFLFGLFSYSLVYSFADKLIPFAFGENYSHTSIYTKEMFLTMIVFPTFFFQANILIAMKLEKVDMLLNIIGLVTYLIIGFIGFNYLKSLSTINYSIFISFIIVHIFQDIILIKKSISTTKYVVCSYLIAGLLVGTYLLLSIFITSYLVFIGYWLSLVGTFFLFKERIMKTPAEKSFLSL